MDRSQKPSHILERSDMIRISIDHQGVGRYRIVPSTKGLIGVCEIHHPVEVLWIQFGGLLIVRNR